MEQIDYTALLPEKPLGDIVSFAYQQGRFQKQYLIYRAEREYVPLEERTRPAVLVTCSKCQKSFYAEKIAAEGCSAAYAPAPFGWWDELGRCSVTSGDLTRCPACGTEAQAVHIGNIRTYGGEIVDDVLVSELTRLPVEGRQDRLVLLDWCIRRCVDKQGGTRHEIWPYSAWVVEERKIVRLMGYAKSIGGAISLFGQWRQRKTFADVYGTAHLLMPWDRSLLEGTTAEHCKLDLYIAAGGTRLVSYLALWRRRPAVENLLVQDCGGLVCGWILRETESGYYHGGVPKLEQVNWKEQRPARMLGLNKEEFRYMRRMDWGLDGLENYRLVRDSGLTVRLPEDMELLRHVQPYECEQILRGAPQRDFWRILRYLARQKAHWSTLRDYWQMAREDGRDLEEPLVRLPRNLTAAHNRQIRERQDRRDREWKRERAKERAERREKFRARSAALEPFAYALNGLLIRPCRTETELIREGRELHHCVASYAQRHACGDTAIFFIRRAAEPDKPYFTLELDEKTLTVRQDRGLRNCERTPEVKAFEQAWLNWLRGNRKGAKTA